MKSVTTRDLDRVGDVGGYVATIAHPTFVFRDGSSKLWWGREEV